MQVNASKIKSIQRNNVDNNKDDVSLLASCEVINHIASQHPAAYRLSAGAKRMLILKRLDTCKSDRDFALLMRLLNDIDKVDDELNSGDKDVIFTWASDSTNDG